jgi:hypothetical protein
MVRSRGIPDWHSPAWLTARRQPSERRDREAAIGEPSNICSKGSVSLPSEKPGGALSMGTVSGKKWPAQGRPF